MKRVSMIVSSQYVAEARQLAVLLKFTDIPENIFIAELSETGSYPVTHYGLSTLWTSDAANALVPKEYDTENNTEIILPSDIDKLIEIYNLPVNIKTQLETLISNISIIVDDLSIDPQKQFEKNMQIVGVTRIANIE
jgi:hypothetical protein